MAPLRRVVTRWRGDDAPAPRNKRAYLDRLECGHVVVIYGRPAVYRRCGRCRSLTVAWW